MTAPTPGTVLQGDARALPLGDASVDLVVTSPPYFGLRSYTGAENELGAEPTPGEYVDALLAATTEMVRVLKPTGSIWVNLGDRYGANKSLLGLPWRYAHRCMDDLGLVLRAEVVWSKTRSNYTDAKARDRVRRTHETWFHLTTPGPYFSAVDDLREQPTSDYRDRPQFRRAMELFTEAGFTDAHMAAVRSVGVIDSRGGQVRSGGSWNSAAGILAAEVQVKLRSYYRELCGNNTAPRGRVPGSVWDIPTQSLKLPAHLDVDHFATFPPEWPRRIIRGWCPPDGVVLDPFGGLGTTALVAGELGRTGISVDLSADYCRVARWRLGGRFELEGDAA